MTSGLRAEARLPHRYPLRRTRRGPSPRALCVLCHAFEPLYEGTICAHCYAELGAGG